MSDSFAYITLLSGRAGTACVQAFLLASCSFSVLRLRVTSMPLQLSYVIAKLCPVPQTCCSTQEHTTTTSAC